MFIFSWKKRIYVRFLFSKSFHRTNITFYYFFSIVHFYQVGNHDDDVPIFVYCYKWKGDELVIFFSSDVHYVWYRKTHLCTLLHSICLWYVCVCERSLCVADGISWVCVGCTLLLLLWMRSVYPFPLLYFSSPSRNLIFLDVMQFIFVCPFDIKFKQFYLLSAYIAI